MPGLRLVSGSNAGICFLAILLFCILAFAGCTDNEPDDTTDLVSENEPNDTLVQATGIPVGVTVIGTVDQGDDFADFFIFSVFVSGSYTMTLSGFGANDLDLLLYDRNGLLLARADSDGASREIVRFLDVDVQYVIEVRAVDAPSTTAYTLRIDGQVGLGERSALKRPAHDESAREQAHTGFAFAQGWLKSLKLFIRQVQIDALGLLRRNFVSSGTQGRAFVPGPNSHGLAFG